MLSGWGRRPATTPRPGLSLLSLGRSSPGSAARTRRAARRRGRGAPPGGCGPAQVHTHTPHPQAAGPGLPGGERGRSQHTRDPEPCKEPGAGALDKRSLPRCG